MISPEVASIKHTNADPNLDSKPMSAHLLRLSNALWTSATCMLMDFALVAPSVHISHFLSPRFGIEVPDATSYSIPCRDWNEGVIGMPSHIVFGMTVSQAPVSAVSSVSYHSSSDGDIGHNDAFVAWEK